MNTTETVIDPTLSGRAFRLAIAVFTEEHGRGPWMPDERTECRATADRWIADGHVR